MLSALWAVTHSAVDAIGAAPRSGGRELQRAKTDSYREILAAAVYWLHHHRGMPIGVAIDLVAHVGVRVGVGRRKIPGSAASVRRAWNQHRQSELIENFAAEITES